jgi:imidazolonepropionase-like amidohydrolase
MLNFRFLLLLFLIAGPGVAQERPVTIRVGTLLDGKGGVQRNVNIVVQGSKIQAITPGSASPTYDLRSLTVMPGMIDTHVHINWHFGKDGRYEPRAQSPAEVCLAKSPKRWKCWNLELLG